FLWPAGQAFWQSMLREDAFGLSREFVGFGNFALVLGDSRYDATLLTTLGFSLAVAVLALGAGLLLAVLANRIVRGAASS
ncbi:glycerol-3-phosphate transporter permease, partial [Klebsiella variicola]|nr:glycerol-3-phosphate transporter permease [Klebsiella variicola]